jgi:hypothetical protein
MEDSESPELSPAARAASFGSGLVHMVSDALGRLSRTGGGGGSGGGCVTPAPEAAAASTAGGYGGSGGTVPAADAPHRATGDGSTAAF